MANGSYLVLNGNVTDNYIANDLKYDLEKLINTGSCYGLGCYIYQLIEYIQDYEDEQNPM